MIEKIFLQVLNMSLTAVFVIILVLIARLFLKKSPKVLSYALWGVVLFRLICPFSFESIFSLLPINSNPIPLDIVYEAIPTIDTGISAINHTVNQSLPAAAPAASINPLQIWTFIGYTVWLMGMAVLLIYSIFSLVKLQRRLRNAVHEKDNIYLVEHLDTPFVMGIVRPKIYLPATLTEGEKRYILLHEQMHIRRFDHVIRIVSFLVLCLHWFNPLVWIAFFVSGKDMEMSCDEAVIKQLGSDVKKEYSSSLLTLATGRSVIGGSPLAFGEGDTRGRIKNVLNYKKPAFWVVTLSLIIVVVLGIGLATNQKTNRSIEMSGNHLSDLQPGEIVRNIAEIIKTDTEALTQDQAVVLALTSGSNRYLEGECFAEGHIILGTDKKRDTTKIYALTMVGHYGFQNGNFVKVSGTGVIPAVVTLKGNNDVSIEYPKDGSYYATSIRKMFPSKYHTRIFDDRESDKKSLEKQEHAYAEEYLSKIGRRAEIGDYGDFEHTLLTDLGVSVGVSNKLLEDFYKEHSNYPYFIGTQEYIENNLRMVYQMSYHENQKEIKFTKYAYDSKEILEQFIMDATTGRMQ